MLLLGRWAGLRGRWLPRARGRLAMAGFVVLARPQPSVLRAAAMGAVALLALATGRRRRSLAALARDRAGAAAGRPVAGPLLRVRAVGAGDRQRWSLLATAWAGALVERAVSRARWPQALAVAAGGPARLRAGGGAAQRPGQPGRGAGEPARRRRPSPRPPCWACWRRWHRRCTAGTAAALAWAAGGSVWWIVHVARRAAAAARGCGRLARVRVAGAASARRGVSLVAVTARAVRGPTAGAGRCLRGRPGGRPRGAGAGAGLAAARTGCWPPATSARATRWSWPPVRGTAVVVDAGPDPAAVDRCLRRLGRRAGGGAAAHPPARRPRRGAARRAARPAGRRGAGRPARRAGRRAGPGPRLGGGRRGAGDPGPPRRPGAGRAGVVEVLWPARVVHRRGPGPTTRASCCWCGSHGLSLLLTGDVEPQAQRALLARGGLGRRRRAQGRPPRLGLPGPGAARDGCGRGWRW